MLKLPFKQGFSDQMCGLLDGMASQQREITMQRKEMLRKEMVSKSERKGATQGAAKTTEKASSAASLASRGPSPGARAMHKTYRLPDLCDLPADQVQYAKCPPGNYMTDSERAWRELRLRQALCIAKQSGWVTGIRNDANHTSLTSEHYAERGYMTYESSSWPKPVSCKAAVDYPWRKAHPMYAVYRPDFSPINYKKLQCSKYSVDFLKSWKVASMTFPAYLECEYPGCDWEEVPSTDDLQP